MGMNIEESKANIQETKGGAYPDGSMGTLNSWGSHFKANAVTLAKESGQRCPILSTLFSNLCTAGKMRLKRQFKWGWKRSPKAEVPELICCYHRKSVVWICVLDANSPNLATYPPFSSRILSKFWWGIPFTALGLHKVLEMSVVISCVCIIVPIPRTAPTIYLSLQFRCLRPHSFFKFSSLRMTNQRMCPEAYWMSSWNSIIKA